MTLEDLRHSASVKEKPSVEYISELPQQTLNLFLKFEQLGRPRAGRSPAKCIQVSEDLPTISLWNKVRAPPCRAFACTLLRTKMAR